ncbi:phosphoribosyl transferase [Pseudomonas sp. MYb185]|nr:phosphoribosyltransferase family protein [Pseudomonas sp. MYb185]PRB80234.1 phosphoribosyl transferase [Pseudomonas sp. MYb185]
MTMIYSDRIEAGQALAAELGDYAGRRDMRLLALPRGGVPVAAEIASALQLPLDILLVRKLGIPGHEEFAMGAIASGGSCYLDRDVIGELNISAGQVEATLQREQAELQRRSQVYRGSRAEPDLQGCDVILVDDGLATGATMRAAIDAVRAGGAQTVVVAVPVVAAETCRQLEVLVDRLVCPHRLEFFRGVGLWYADFQQVSDEEVIELLQRHRPEATDEQH